MKNYICINGQQVELTQEQVARLRDICKIPSVKLSEVAVGDTVMIGDHEMVVLDQFGEATALIRKDLLVEEQVFGESNNYAGSAVDKLCEEFADEIAGIVGADSLLLHRVDLTADDGLKDYGAIDRRVALLTANEYRRYVYVLDKHKVDEWWWLATAYSTPTHGYDRAVKCVSPSGCIGYDFYWDCFGVRPFCILKSTIFVSKKEEKENE